MTGIYSGYDIFQIVKSCTFTPSVVVERTGRDYQYDKCVDTYSFEITSDMVFQYKGRTYQVTDDMVGIWNTGWERHQFHQISFENFIDYKLNQALCLRREVRNEQSISTIFHDKFSRLY